MNQLTPEQIIESRGLDVVTLVNHGATLFRQHGISHCKFEYRRNGQAVNAKYRTIEGEKNSGKTLVLSAFGMRIV